MNMKKEELLACAVGIIVGAACTHIVLSGQSDHNHEEEYQHPIGYADNAEEVHVHSDFILYLDGTHYDLSDDKYQSGGEQVLHKHVHLHDNDDDVIHRHDHDITLGDFFGSLGFTLENDSITNDEGITFTNDDVSELMVFVNDERIDNPKDYVNEEEDLILVYFGDKNDSETIQTLLLEITDKACIYSGTCPERGTAPQESCGLTCEL